MLLTLVSSNYNEQFDQSKSHQTSFTALHKPHTLTMLIYAQIEQLVNKTGTENPRYITHENISQTKPNCSKWHWELKTTTLSISHLKAGEPRLCQCRNGHTRKQQQLLSHTRDYDTEMVVLESQEEPGLLNWTYITMYRSPCALYQQHILQTSYSLCLMSSLIWYHIRYIHITDIIIDTKVFFIIP